MMEKKTRAKKRGGDENTPLEAKTKYNATKGKKVARTTTREEKNERGGALTPRQKAHMSTDM